MKISCSSWSHSRLIRSGTLTLLDWVRECGRLGLDGVEMLLKDMPSTDRDYLIELKKTCTDGYLTTALRSRRCEESALSRGNC